MYIVPNTEIYLLTGVPIEPNYNHTLYFNTLADQVAYFTDPSRVLFRLTNYSRIQMSENQLKVEIGVDQLYSANYMMFRNNSFGPKPFFAFITNVEYVNNRTTLITYTLDVMQTWLFDHQLGQCFVEREHSATDNPGDNLIPENFELGDYIYEEYDLPDDKNMFSEWAIFVGSTVNADGEDIDGKIYQGMYSGVTWIPFLNASAVNTYLSALTDSQKSNAIIGIVMLPKRCAEISDTQNIVGVELGVPKNYYPNGYNPKNKKLCTAPYTQMLVTDYQGHAASYKYEYFNYATNDEIKFLVEAPISSVPQFINTPLYYKGLSEGPTQKTSYHESLIISDMPQCAFTIDSYRAWIAMASNKVGLATDLIGGVANTAMGALDTYVAAKTGAHTGIIGKHQINKTGSPDHEGIIGGVFELGAGISRIAQAVSRWYDASMMPPQAKSIGGGSAIFQTGAYGFHYLYCFIREEYAQIIDDFFTMYGYATNRVKFPNVRNSPALMRPYWNYIKVSNCKLDGSVPTEYERMLHDIYENGITFWSAPWDVGNYSLDNSPNGG